MRLSSMALICAALAMASCSSDDDGPGGSMPHDPATAAHVSVDRFSEAAGHLMVRTADNGLPAANAPVNFDEGPFITRGLGPQGSNVRYYNFDVQPRTPAPIYAFFREGENTSLPGQLNVIGVIPGDPGYSDFWQVMKVTVPADYVANTIASEKEVLDSGYDVEATRIVVNCPVVPEGSTATKRLGGGPAGLTSGWYEEKVVFYFDFSEKMLAVQDDGLVPVSPIYVTFKVNPDPTDASSGPASGFVTEDGSDQTHNVVETVPADAAYSPLWSVNVYDNADFDSVSNLDTAKAANVLALGVATVNCPIVEEGS